MGGPTRVPLFARALAAASRMHDRARFPDMRHPATRLLERSKQNSKHFTRLC